MELRAARPEDRGAVEAFLRDVNALRAARRGELVETLDHPMVLAWTEGVLSAVATYIVAGDRCELLTLHASVRHAGTGSALLAEVRRLARAAGCHVLHVVTTNDNVDALRFYQRRGFVLAELRPGAVDLSRERLKPEIPATGAYDIPLRDEIELEMELPQSSG